MYDDNNFNWLTESLTGVGSREHYLTKNIAEYKHQIVQRQIMTLSASLPLAVQQQLSTTLHISITGS